MNNLLPNLFMFISISADNPYDKGKCKVPRGRPRHSILVLQKCERIYKLNYTKIINNIV